MVTNKFKERLPCCVDVKYLNSEEYYGISTQFMKCTYADVEG